MGDEDRSIRAGESGEVGITDVGIDLEAFLSLYVI